MIPIADDNPTRRRAWVTIALILVNVAVYFFVQHGAPTDRFSYEHAAIPCEITTGEPLSPTEIQTDTCEKDDVEPPYFVDKHVLVAALVSMFLHGSLLHLGGNMLFLWIFGNNIEDRLGRVKYLLFYLAAGVVAMAAHLAVQPHSTVPVIGASGAIAGVMGAYLIWFPNVRVRAAVFLAFFVVFPRIRAKWLLGIWFVLQFFTAPGSGVAWMAHVGGFVFGALFALLRRRARPLPAW
jgi:membrane associated rhomboid family serine protease